MKKLILLVAIFVAASYQSSNAQISFDLNISSGPRYVPAYYQPVAYYEPRRVHYVPVRHYAPPRRVVYVEKRGHGHYKKGPKHVYSKSYYRPAPRRVVYAKHYKQRYSAPRTYKRTKYNAVTNRYTTRTYHRR